MTTQSIAVLSIVGQHKFYATLSNFLGIIGYWAGEISELFRPSINNLINVCHDPRGNGICGVR
jgi:hypothetical protein